jgi:uncharacterized protein
MTKLVLPAKIDPVSFARANRLIAGVISFAELPRLSEALASNKGEAKFELEFKVDEEGFVVIEVKAQASLPLTCQRCLEPCLYTVQLHSELSPISDDSLAKKLPSRYEAWPLSEDLTLSPKEILEEELLLSLPIVPMHAIEDCSAEIKVLDDSENEQEQATHKPFEILKKLK